MEVDFPLGSHGGLGDWKNGQVRRRAEFGCDCKELCSCMTLRVGDLFPPMNMRLHGRLPLERAGIGNLGGVGVPDPGMDMLHGRAEGFDRLTLILTERFADIAPMRHVKNEFCIGSGSQEFSGAPWRVQAASAMGLVIDRNPCLAGYLICHFKDAHVFLKIETITPGVAIDKKRLE